MKNASGTSAAPPVILFGACDRHNLGDLLFPHVVAAMLQPRAVVCAGLGRRDMRPFGGQRVEALPQLAAVSGARRAELIHVGGEILTCTAWQAAVMLSAPESARGAIARHVDADAQRTWARSVLRTDRLAPYVAAPSLFPCGVSSLFNAVGGVELETTSKAMCTEVCAALRAAELVTVRDRMTRQVLRRHGIAAALLPDSAVMAAELFGARIRHLAAHGEPAAVCRAFPQGYLAVQFSAEFGDDATLTAIAAQLDRIVAASGLGIAFFRAGAAPWHDDLEVYQRTAVRLRSGLAYLFESLDIWDICALIANSRGFIGSSLHGRIVAGAFALPRLSVLRDSAPQPNKLGAYAATWEPESVASAAVERIADDALTALGCDAGVLRHAALQLARAYREGFAQLTRALDRRTSE